MVLPLGHDLVHLGDELVVVISLLEVHKLMHNDVFEANDRFLGQFKIEPDALGIHITSSPLGPYLTHTPIAAIYSNGLFPFFNERR
jgi:hypothetical protein